MIFTSPETRMIVLPDSEDRMIISSFVRTIHGIIHRNLMDGHRRTDRQTDMPWLLQSLHCEQYGRIVIKPNHAFAGVHYILQMAGTIFPRPIYSLVEIEDWTIEPESEDVEPKAGLNYCSFTSSAG